MCEAVCDAVEHSYLRGVLEKDTEAEPPGGLGGQQAGGMLKRLQTLGACNDP